MTPASLIRRFRTGLADALERGLERRFVEPRRPPLFIIGPARSGTTLIYQSITQAFRTAYLSNNFIKYRAYPSLAAFYIAARRGRRPPRVYESRFGRTIGRTAPAQGHEFWERWFPADGDTTAQITWSDSERRRLVSAIACLEAAYGGPFVNKWPAHSIHLPLLHRAFPSALYLRVRRDLRATAESVLAMRMEHGDRRATISRMPRSYAAYRDRSPIEQVCAYVLGVNAQVDHDLPLIGADRCLEVNYEEFCASPRETMNRLSDFYRRRSGVELRSVGELPGRFEPSAESRVSVDDSAAIARCLAEQAACSAPV